MIQRHLEDEDVRKYAENWRERTKSGDVKDEFRKLERERADTKMTRQKCN